MIHLRNYSSFSILLFLFYPRYSIQQHERKNYQTQFQCIIIYSLSAYSIYNICCNSLYDKNCSQMLCMLYAIYNVCVHIFVHSGLIRSHTMHYDFKHVLFILFLMETTLCYPNLWIACNLPTFRLPDFIIWLRKTIYFCSH